MSIRRLRPDEAEILLELCAEHADYERSSFLREDQPRRWREALASSPPRLYVWILELDETLQGFAAAALEYNTWQAREILHLDCLYLRPGARGSGWGSRLLAQVAAQGRRLGCTELQWQTPPWNEKAITFYEARGARCCPKTRFTLDLALDESTGCNGDRLSSDPGSPRRDTARASSRGRDRE